MVNIERTRNKFVIRKIPYIYLVGQTFPLYQVPPPNSRPVHQYLRNYIEVFATREMKRKDNVKKRLPVREIIRAFPLIPSAVVKKKMKEIADMTRKEGDRMNWWYLRNGAMLMHEEELRRKVTPEMVSFKPCFVGPLPEPQLFLKVCVFESMLVAQQHLKDAGYQNHVNEEEEEEDEGNMVDDELKLVPWRLSKNVIAAFQVCVCLSFGAF